MGDWVMNHWPDLVPIIFHVLNFIISFGVVMFLFALLFKILPDAKIQWKHIWLGSILAAFLFILGKTAIGLYLSKANPGLAYGAEFTRAYADHFTGKVSATEVAVKITDKEH
jgi:membrane protein